MKLFPGLPKDLGSLTVQQIEELIAEYEAAFVKAKARDPEFVGELTAEELLVEARAAKDELVQLRGEVTGRAELEASLDSELSSLAAEAGVESAADGVIEDAAAEVAAEAADDVTAEAEAATQAAAESDEPAEPAEPTDPAPDGAEVAAEQVPVLASAAKMPAARPSLPRPTGAHSIQVRDRSGTALVASAGLEGFAPNHEFDRQELAEAIIRKLRTRQAMPNGMREDVVIASAFYGDRFPDELRLLGDSNDSAKIQAVIEARKTFDGSDEAVVASGGLCAPVTPYYELMNVAVADRPVRDSLANFNAVRGGLQFAAPPVIGDITTGVGVKTAAQDAAGGTTAEKSCQVVDCPDFSTVELAMVYHCLQFGNLNARAFPEMIATYTDLVMAAHARVAESRLLSSMWASATKTTQAAVYGATSTIIMGLLQAAAGMRSRLRMRQQDRFHVWLPEWLPDVIAADLVNSQFIRFEYARNDIETLLNRYGVNVTWYLDGPAGGGQVYGAQTPNAATLPFPTSVKGIIAPEASYLFLDGGTLDLGIVRDSILNNTNDWQQFGETFEEVAFVGPESLGITFTVCPSGTTGGTATAITCS